MDRIIQLLVEFDKKGQQIVLQAQDQRRDVLGHMSDYKQELSAQYHERAKNRMETFRLEAQADRDEQLALVRKRFEEQNARLRASYQKNSGQWITQIVDRALGR